MEKERNDLLMMLQASSSLGWSDTMTGPVRDAAEHEAEFVNYMFPDAQDFLKSMITAMMDEPSTRESCTRVVLKIHKQLPFLLINDLRISTGNNSLQRIEVIKGLLQRAQSS